MPSGPPKALEAVVGLWVPPACREEVLGDLCEKYTGPGQYIATALRVVPFVIVSRIRRTTDAQVLVTDGSQAHSVLPSDYRDALEAMQQKMVNIEIRDASSQWLRMLANAVPFFVLLGFWVFMMRRLPGRDAK